MTLWKHGTASTMIQNDMQEKLAKSQAFLKRLEHAVKAPNLPPEAKRQVEALIRKQKAVILLGQKAVAHSAKNPAP
jgi:hypothetical protein